MFKLIIVDDERMTRESLKNYLPWNALEVGSVRVARNGVEALTLAAEDPPEHSLALFRHQAATGISFPDNAFRPAAAIATEAISPARPPLKETGR